MKQLIKEKKGEVIVFKIDGDVEFDDSIQLNETFTQTIAEGNAKIVIDLVNVTILIVQVLVHWLKVLNQLKKLMVI